MQVKGPALQVLPLMVFECVGDALAPWTAPGRVDGPKGSLSVIPAALSCFPGASLFCLRRRCFWVLGWVLNPVDFIHSSRRFYYLLSFYLIFNYLSVGVFDRRFWGRIGVFDRKGIGVFERG